MADIEKVIKGLKCIKGDTVPCKDCGYSDEDGHGHYMCHKNCASEVIALLKEQQKRIETLESLRRIEQEGR